MTPQEKRKQTILERFPGGFKEIMGRAKQTEIERLGGLEAYIEVRRKNGAVGGRRGTTGGFAANRELAREAGRKGGMISRRKKAVLLKSEQETE